MPFLKNDNIQIYYNHTGESDKPPLLFCNGYGPASRYIEDFYMPSFSDRFHCATFDIRGIGQSEEPVEDSEFSLEKLASDALAVMDELGWDTAHIWGVSLGTVVACTTTLRAPDRIRSITLNGFDPGNPSLMQRKYMSYVKARYDYFKRAVSKDLSPREKARKMLANYGPVDTPRGERIVQYYTEMLEKKGSNRQWSMMENIVPLSREWEDVELSLPVWTEPVVAENPTQVYHRLHDIQAPTLICHGYGDPLISMDGPLYAFHAMPNVELRLYKDVMHSFSFRPEILKEECDWIEAREIAYQAG